VFDTEPPPAAVSGVAMVPPQILRSLLLGLTLPLGAGLPAVHGVHDAPCAPVAALARGKFLVAARQLSDPNFAETVVLLLAHDGSGAMGVVVNRPTPVELHKVLPELEALRDRSDTAYLGGPMAPEGLIVLVRTREKLAGSEPVFADVVVTGSSAALERVLVARTPPERLRAYVGYAGWAPRQLDAEVARGDWHVLPGEADAVFSTAPRDLWPRLIERCEGEWVWLDERRPGACTERIEREFQAARTRLSDVRRDLRGKGR
jgi:putative transcriptional regulator